MRKATVSRKTNETDIKVSWNLDGSGKSEIDSGNGFFDHMLEQLSKHGRFDIDVYCKGDTHVDFHHSAEDIGICLGKAFKEALDDCRGITRYADTTLPMDEALILSAVDISGRDLLCFSAEFPTESVGEFDTQLVEVFFDGFVRNAGITLHIRKLAGKNTHHIIEGIFKSVAKTLSKAVKINEDCKNEIPSTKGSL